MRSHSTWPFFVFLLLSGLLFAQQSEKLTLQKYQSHELLLPFVVEKYDCTNTTMQITPSMDKRKLTLLAQEAGTATLRIFGTQGETKLYVITTEEDIGAVFKRLRSDLESLPELDITQNQNKIRISGVISQISSWERLQKILPDYGDTVLNLATFEPTPEVFQKFITSLEEAGFTVTKTRPDHAVANELYVRFEENIIYVDGKVLRKEDLTIFENVVKVHHWIVPVSNEVEGKQVDGSCKILYSLSVMPALIDVGAVYVAVSNSEGTIIGNKGYDGKILDFNIANWFRSNRDHSSDTGHSNSWSHGFLANLDLGLNGSLRFFAENGVSRFRTAGHVSFLSDQEGSGVMNTGGTVYVRVAGPDVTSLEEINYGFRLEVSGALISANKVRLNVNLSKNDEPILKEGSSDYGQKKNEYSGTIVCELGKTVVLGGVNDLVEVSSNSGLVGLRHVPVLKWFTAAEENPEARLRLLLMISPRLITENETATIDIPVSEETSSVVEEASKPLVDERPKTPSTRHWYFLWLF